ncbi:MAG TPA: CBS domain-containing protein, partial [Stellaceae bacterium]
MEIREIMSRDVRTASPTQTLQDAARIMADHDVGALPVCDEGVGLVGMITDRDIALRGVAERLDPKRTTVGTAMTDEVYFCFEDDAVEDVAEQLAELRIRRLPVLDDAKRLVGIVSLKDITTAAAGAAPDVARRALRGISRPGGPHDQTR